jgi:hypothetical protein
MGVVMGTPSYCSDLLSAKARTILQWIDRAGPASLEFYSASYETLLVSIPLSLPTGATTCQFKNGWKQRGGSNEDDQIKA